MGRHAVPELDCSTDVLPRVGGDEPAVAPETGWRAGVEWCLEHQYRLAAIIAAAILLLAVVLSSIDAGTSTSAEHPALTSYQQGYSYGQSLDNQGYTSDEAYAACRDEVSQDQVDILTFQLGCDIGYHQ